MKLITLQISDILDEDVDNKYSIFYNFYFIVRNSMETKLEILTIKQKLYNVFKFV